MGVPIAGKIKNRNLIGYLPKKVKRYVHIKTYMRKFMVVLFIIANFYQQVNGWTNCGTSIQRNTTQQGKNELLIHTT